MQQISQRMTLLAAIASGTILISPITEAAVRVGSSPWFWQDPLPQGNSLNAISCPNLSVCFAGGRPGYDSQHDECPHHQSHL
jgi:hypothetical protein